MTTPDSRAGDRYDPRAGAQTMKAVVTMGNGGYDKLEYRDVPVPTLGPGEVLLRVLAAGVNNTEINTRLGWYSSTVTTGTEEAPARAESRPRSGRRLERGHAVSLHPGHGLLRPCRRGRPASTGAHRRAGAGARVHAPRGFESMENVWMASDFDGAFASS